MSSRAMAGYSIPVEQMSGKAWRKAYQFLQLRVQKVGRGITNEILMLHVNGKQFTAGVKKLDDSLNFPGSQGFKVVTAEMETEGVYTYFYTLQREILTDQPINIDIVEQLETALPGATVGQSARTFEFIGMGDNW